MRTSAPAQGSVRNTGRPRGASSQLFCQGCLRASHIFCQINSPPCRSIYDAFPRCGYVELLDALPMRIAPVLQMGLTVMLRWLQDQDWRLAHRWTVSSACPARLVEGLLHAYHPGLSDGSASLYCRPSRDICARKLYARFVPSDFLHKGWESNPVAVPLSEPSMAHHARALRAQDAEVL